MENKLEIVYCKDCEHRYTGQCALFYGSSFVEKVERYYWCGSCQDDNFYCAKGVKKE